MELNTVVDYVDTIEPILKNSVEGQSYVKNNAYDTNYIMDILHAMFAAIRLASKDDENMEEAAKRLDISNITPDRSGNATSPKWAEVIDGARFSTGKKPHYAIIHDPAMDHFSALAFDRDDFGRFIVTAFDGMGKGRFDLNENMSLQQQIKLHLPDEAIFNDRSQAVQVEQCCGLTVAAFISDYEQNREQYLTDPQYVSKNPLLNYREFDKQKEGYAQLGVSVFAAIEVAADMEQRPMYDILEKQIADDEKFALKLAAEEAGLDVSATTTDIKTSQKARWAELVGSSAGNVRNR